ncbi:MAG: hypothetical protein J5978_07035 [Spirochaetaceae bacterium]|nr:hypothetical protein [Spirochaetaceae bacterium]
MKSIFSKSVLKTTGRELKKEITEAVKGTKALKKVVNMICQQANRRIQNVEKAGLASPAVKAVYAERGKKGYTYFSTAGLDPTNENDWERIKYEYGRAMSFLNNPTSSATGARQYIKYQATQLNNIPFESANKIIDLATSPTIDNYGNVNIFSYGSILDEFKNDVMQTGNEMEVVGEAYGRQLEIQLQAVINSITAQASQPFLDRFIQ